MSYNTSQESKNELSNETLSVSININKIRSLVGLSNTSTRDQQEIINKNDDNTLDNKDNIYTETITLSVSRSDIALLLAMARDIFMQPPARPAQSAGKDFGEIIGREQFEIIASYWQKNVDDQIGTVWLNRVLNEASIPDSANSKYISDLLKQSYFRVLDQFANKRSSIAAPRIYAKKVILSVFNGD